VQAAASTPQVGGEDLSGSTELSGAADPLRLTARHEIDLPGRVLSLSFVVYNRLPSEVSGVTIRCGSPHVLMAGPALRTRLLHGAAQVRLRDASLWDLCLPW